MIAPEPTATYRFSDIRSVDIHIRFFLYVWQTCVLTCSMILWSTSTTTLAVQKILEGSRPRTSSKLTPHRYFDTVLARWGV